MGRLAFSVGIMGAIHHRYTPSPVGWDLVLSGLLHVNHLGVYAYIPGVVLEYVVLEY